MKSIIAKFLTSAADPKFFSPEGPPEFAFLGRSNVGKSSLVNSLLRKPGTGGCEKIDSSRLLHFSTLIEKCIHGCQGSLVGV
jgi:hypothetical protein